MSNQIATFEEAEARLLAHLDRYHDTVRTIAKDRDHTNKESAAMKAAIKGYIDTLDDIFALKCLLDDINRLSPNP